MSRNPNNASFNMDFNDTSYFDIDFNNTLTFEAGMQELTAIYVDDHTKLRRRDAEDQHPISSITGLVAALNAKQDSLIAESDSGIVIENNYIRLDDLILNCGTSTTVI